LLDEFRIGPQAGRNERLTDLFAFAVLQVDGEVVWDLRRESIHDGLVEARAIVVHGQVVEPVGPIGLFLPALLVDFRHRPLGEPARSLHITRNGLVGGFRRRNLNAILGLLSGFQGSSTLHG
jgi:hypothetical protein